MPIGQTPPSLPGVSHEWVDAGGLRTHVALAGPGDAPPVILVHGWPQHWWCWRRLIAPLAETHRVIAPDLRGHGWTEAPQRGYEKEQLASDLLAVLDTLGLERVTWVGHDWGAWTGILAALRAPERFERLLACCVPHPWTARADPRRLALLAYQGPISLPLAGRALAPALTRRILGLGRGEDRLLGEDLALFSEHVPARVTVAMYRTFLTRELPGLLGGRYAGRRLEVPTTLLVGARDLVTAGVSPGPVDGQPELTVERVAGVGHWLPEQRPGEILERL